MSNMSKSTPMSPEEQAEFLSGLGLNPQAPAIVAEAAPTMPARTPHVQADTAKVVLAPPGVDPRAMPVDEIVFDEHLLDGFPSLGGDNLKYAYDYVFAFYKSYTKGDRNKALHRRVSSFLTTTRRNRETGGMVKEGIKSTKEQRDNAALLASQNVSSADLAEALRLLAEKRVTSNTNG